MFVTGPGSPAIHIARWKKAAQFATHLKPARCDEMVATVDARMEAEIRTKCAGSINPTKPEQWRPHYR